MNSAISLSENLRGILRAVSRLPRFEIARMLVRFDHVAHFIRVAYGCATRASKTLSNFGELPGLHELHRAMEAFFIYSARVKIRVTITLPIDS